MRRASDEREVQIDGYQSDRSDQESWLGPLLSTAGASAEFFLAVCAAGEGSESKHRAEARDPGCFSLRRPADRSGAGFYSGFGLCGRRGRVTRGLEAFSAPLPARGCSGTCKVDCRGKMISEASPRDQV